MPKTLVICAAIACAALTASSASATGIKPAPGASCHANHIASPNLGECVDQAASVATVSGRGAVGFTITGHITLHADNASVLVDLERGDDIAISGDTGFVSNYRAGNWAGRYIFAHHLDLYATCPHRCLISLVAQTSFHPRSWPLPTSFRGVISGTGFTDVSPTSGMHSPSITNVATNDGGRYLLADVSGYSRYAANELQLGRDVSSSAPSGGSVRAHFRRRLEGDGLTALEMQRAAFDPAFTANFPIPKR